MVCHHNSTSQCQNPFCDESTLEEGEDCYMKSGQVTLCLLRPHSCCHCGLLVCSTSDFAVEELLFCSFIVESSMVVFESVACFFVSSFVCIPIWKHLSRHDRQSDDWWERLKIGKVQAWVTMNAVTVVTNVMYVDYPHLTVWN